MLAVQIAATGGPEVLDVVELPTPAPGPGQILVRNQAIGLNFVDTYMRSGLYPISLPAVLGSEGAGIVEAAGAGVTRFKPGDRVGYGAGGTGAYALFHLVPADRAARLPDGIPTRTAAAAMLKGMTAEFLLRRCYPVASGEAILVWAAAGGVGLILSQWAKALGATVIGCVGSPSKVELATSHGCDHVILYKDEDVAGRVREITGGAGVRVVYDGVGRASQAASLKSLGRRGMLVSFGNASGPAPAVEPLTLSRAGSLYLTRPTLYDYITTAEEHDESASALFEVIGSGAVKILVGAEFPLRDARKAHEAIQSGETVGSTLLIP